MARPIATPEQIRATAAALQVGLNRTRWIIQFESDTSSLAMMLAIAYCQGIKDYMETMQAKDAANGCGE